MSEVSVKLDGNEIWEWLYGDLRGKVPEALTDDVLNRLAAHIREHFGAALAPPVEAEPVAWPINGPLHLQPDAYSILEVSPDKTGYLFTIHSSSEEVSRWDDLSVHLPRKMAADLAGLLPHHPSPTPPDDVAEGMVNDLSSAPRDGTMLCLLVRYDHGNMACHPLADSADPSWTIGFNNLDNDGEDVWRLAGWDWEQDVFRQSEGEPIGWMPFAPASHTQALRDDPNRERGSDWNGDRDPRSGSDLD